jgi:hypothetical protein
MTMSDDDPVLARDQLARYQVPSAPSGFSDRVMAAIASDTGDRRSARPRRAIIAAASVFAIAAAAVLFVVLRSGTSVPAVDGARQTEARETIEVADRAVVVASGGTRLQWHVANHDAVVDQTSGSAFYRVERGGRFDVRTPLGVVSVTGTCFSVEVMSMKNPFDPKTLRGAAVGAAIATGVIVAVYEGNVSLANPAGRLKLGAGETGVIDHAAPPVARTADTSGSGALAAANARIASLEAENTKLRAGSGSAAPADEPSDPAYYYAPSADSLREMAQDCEIVYDLPGLNGNDLVDRDRAAEIGISDAERAAINRAYATVSDRAVEQLRHLYVELTGTDPDVAAALSANALEEEIRSKSGEEAELEARTRFARERAGLEPMPTPAELARRPPIERYLQIVVNLGNEAETAAASVVGATRARELRAHDNAGWHSSVNQRSGCTVRHY